MHGYCRLVGWVVFQPILEGGWVLLEIEEYGGKRCTRFGGRMCIEKVLGSGSWVLAVS